MVDEADGSYGGMLTKLLFRTLPACYPVGSVYSHFPFLVPNYLHSRIINFPENLSEHYTWTRPVPAQQCVIVSAYRSVLQVMAEGDTFVSESDARLRSLIRGTVLSSGSVGRTRIYSLNGCSILYR
jgi:linoleate 10R-lipoxygenase